MDLKNVVLNDRKMTTFITSSCVRERLLVFQNLPRPFLPYPLLLTEGDHSAHSHTGAELCSF